MPIVYSTATATARMQVVLSNLGTNAKLKLFTSSNILLATFTLASIAGTVVGTVLTLSDSNGAIPGILNTIATASGIVTKASLTTSADVVIVTDALTVGIVGSGADIILDSTTIEINQGITINSATITHG